MARLSAGHRRTLGVVASLACVAVAALWLVVVPDEADAATGFRSFLLTYGHSLVWLLLAIAAALFAFEAPRRAIEAVSTTALVVYVAFVVALVVAA